MFLGGYIGRILESILVQKILKCQGPVMRGMETRNTMGKLLS